MIYIADLLWQGILDDEHRSVGGGRRVRRFVVEPIIKLSIDNHDETIIDKRAAYPFLDPGWRKQDLLLHARWLIGKDLR